MVAGALAVQNLWLRKAEPEMGDASEQLPEGAGQNDIEIKLAVIDCGMLRDGQPAAVLTAVADADLVDCAKPGRPFVDGQFDIERTCLVHHPQKTNEIGENAPAALQYF